MIYFRAVVRWIIVWSLSEHARRRDHGWFLTEHASALSLMMYPGPSRHPVDPRTVSRVYLLYDLWSVIYDWWCMVYDGLDLWSRYDPSDLWSRLGMICDLWSYMINDLWTMIHHDQWFMTYGLQGVLEEMLDEKSTVIYLCRALCYFTKRLAFFSFLFW